MVRKAAPGNLARRVFPLNLPNALTLIRILLVPVLVVALTVETPGGSTIAAIVFAIAALTDGLDGYIARSRQSVTTFGKVMDPVADKLMIAAALIALVSLDRLAALGGDGDHRARVRRQRPADRGRPAGRGDPRQRARQGEDDRAGGGGAGADRGERPRRRLGAGARLRDGRWSPSSSGADYFLNFRRKLEEASRARGTGAG